MAKKQKMFETCGEPYGNACYTGTSEGEVNFTVKIGSNFQDWLVKGDCLIRLECIIRKKRR